MTPTELDATEERYRERFPDWQRSDARVCPRTVADKRCRVRHGRASGPGAERRRCVCESRHARRALDHGRTWVNDDGETMLTGEPYGIDGTTLARFAADCTDLGLRVLVAPGSPYDPGGTVLLVIRQPLDHDRA